MKGLSHSVPLHYVVCIPFYVRGPDPQLHFDRLVIPMGETE